MASKQINNNENAKEEQEKKNNKTKQLMIKTNNSEIEDKLKNNLRCIPYMAVLYSLANIIDGRLIIAATSKTKYTQQSKTIREKKVCVLECAVLENVRLFFCVFYGFNRAAASIHFI